MKSVALFAVPTEVADLVFEALGVFAGAFGDNGGEPDRRGPYLAPAWIFTPEEIARARGLGAYLALGWEVEYPGGDPDIPGPWCGYSGAGVAYTLYENVACCLEEYANARLQRAEHDEDDED